MLETGTSGLMSGEGKPPAASRSRFSALPRLYRLCTTSASTPMIRPINGRRSMTHGALLERWRPYAPSRRPEEAQQDAERLARLSPGEHFHVLEAVSLTQKVDVRTVELTEEADEIPF
jgi:hypothetical protein